MDIVNNVYCELCSSILTAGNCTNRNCRNSEVQMKQSIRKKWKIGSEFIIFEKPVSFKEATKRYNKKIKNLYDLRKSKRVNNKY